MRLEQEYARNQVAESCLMLHNNNTGIAVEGIFTSTSTSANLVRGAEEAGVEAAGMNQTASENIATDDYRVALTLLVLFLFSAYKAYKWFLNIVQILFPQQVLENEEMNEENEMNEDDKVPENDSHPSYDALVEMEIAQNNQVNEDDAGSSSVNDDPEVSPEDWERWSQIKESGENERGQRKWKKIMHEVVQNYQHPMIDSAMRGAMIQENWTDTRCKSYKKLLDIEDTAGCTSE